MKEKREFSLILHWYPPRYRVKWAYSREEVPRWDRTRGFDPYAEGPCDGDKPTWSVESSEPTPETPEDLEYPRLVRLDPCIRQGPLPETPVWQELAKLADVFHDTQSFTVNIVRVVEAFGPLDPWDQKFSKDTLYYWQEMVAHVWAFARLYGRIVDNPFGADETDKALLLARGEVVDEWEGRRPLRPDHHESEQTRYDGLISYPISVLDDVLKTARSLADARQQIANRLMHKFTYQMQGNLVYTPDGLLARVGVEGWAHYELATLYQGGRALASCPGCGALFLPQHGSQKYCRPDDSKCRGRAFRRARGASPRRT
ncbi:hypothetical protein [Calidithermus chliarophilus]|uniref:hypothetical protein n=1 Tax=Calidithermus chliarophilus TaxID=52023 RepID=UPI0012F6650C|nr:hypothetical protein [Calidithermus chliarophilus]